MNGKVIVSLMMILYLSGAGLTYGEEQAKDQELPEVVVESKRLVEEQDKITIKSEGLPAKVNIVTKEELKKIPYTGDYLDMLRSISGIQINKVARGDVGHFIGMRGFNSQQSTAIFIDGMPLNTLFWPQGQTQIGWIIPEMIERIEVIKGPFSALYGNFALGGVINFITKKSDPSPSVGGYGGTYDTWRGVGVISDPSWSQSLGNITPFLVWEGYSRNGYRQNSDYQRGQFFNKFTIPLWQGDLSLQAHYAARTWGFPGVQRIDQMKAGIVNRKDAASPYDRGDGEMADVVLKYSPQNGEEGLHASLYYAYMWQAQAGTFKPNPQGRYESTFNYFGWRLLYDYRPFESLSLTIGNELRRDDVRTNISNVYQYYNLIQRTNSYDFIQLSTGFFAQGQYKPFSFLKFIAGIRYDMFDIGVNNNLYPWNSGKASPDMWSPKVGVVITPYKDINIFANKGKGFNSPDVSQLSPSSPIQKANFDLGLAKLDSWDVGINALLFKRLFISFDYFDTRYAREQILNTKTNLYENFGKSKRTGIEVEARIFLTKELTLYGSWLDVRARLKNPTTRGAYYITMQPEDQAIVGLEFQKPWDGNQQQLGLNFYYRRVGRMPANTSGTLIGSQFDQYMGKINYRYKKCTFSLDASLTPRRYAADMNTLIQNQIAITPWPMWDVLAGVRYQF